MLKIIGNNYLNGNETNFTFIHLFNSDLIRMEMIPLDIHGTTWFDKYFHDKEKCDDFF